jgi:pumilio RNA-binding family
LWLRRREESDLSKSVIQHLLERGTPSDRNTIINAVRGQVVTLSKHKFASNVVDKVILCADEAQRTALVDEILYDPTAISEMLKDQFANYATQKFMVRAKLPVYKSDFARSL